jgi:hypothetical protein
MHSIYLNQPRYQDMNMHWLIVHQKAKRDVISIKNMTKYTKNIIIKNHLQFNFI